MTRSTTGCDGEGRVYWDQLDAEDLSPSTGVVEAVLDLEGKDPNEITSLYDVLDPDALDSFIESWGGSGEPHRVSFSYEGYSIEVHSDRRIRLVPNEPRKGHGRGGSGESGSDSRSREVTAGDK